MKRLQIHKLMDDSGVVFGTSGARGLVSAMTDEVCYAYTKAFLQCFAVASDNVSSSNNVVLAHDLRPSSPRIARACAAAIAHSGMGVVFAGAIPTPALALASQESGVPGIMVTGSHVPFDRNGIKFYKPDGEILKADEAAIAASSISYSESLFDGGTLTGGCVPLTQNSGAKKQYIARYIEFFPKNMLSGKRVGVYQHASVARDMLVEVLSALGGEVVPIGRSETFIAIDTEAITAADQQMAQEWVSSYHLDAIVSTDGDGDRPLIADDTGVWLRGDIVGLLAARYLGITTVVTPVSSNTSVELCGYFETIRRTRIGSPYVVEAMTDAIQKGAIAVAGYEANGGFLLGTMVEKNGRILTALPTRDSFLPILAVLANACESGVSLSFVVEELPKRYTASDRIQSISAEHSLALLSLISDGPGVQGLFDVSLGGVKSVDRTDGLRLSFDNSAIIHLRPSGNAPELRCYAESNTPAEAEELVQKTLGRIRVLRLE